MKWDQKNKLFHPGDYDITLRWFTGRDAIDTLILLGLQLKSANPSLEIVQYEREPFIWNRNNLQEAISKSIDFWLEPPIEDTGLITPNLMFRTGVDGIDLIVVFKLIIKEEQPLLIVTSMDFDESHLDLTGGIFSYQMLNTLFRGFVINLKPDYAVISRTPSCTDPWFDWYEETRVNIDTTKIPVQIEWFNFFCWEWVERIGERRFKNVSEGKIEYIPEGIIYIMQKEPFSFENQEHMKRLRRLQRHFRLEKPHRKYRT